MKTILVTGGAGFIGSHLCERLLDAGCKVICLDCFDSFYDPAIKRANIVKARSHPNYTLVEGDIRSLSLLNSLKKNHRIDTVIHLAALAGVRSSLKNPLAYIDVDIKGTANILEFCTRNRVGKLVFASSSSVYGSNPTPFHEEDPLDLQLSPYAAAKRSGELFCHTYNSLYGLPVVCLRFFTVYGPRQRPEMAIHSFTRNIDEGREISIYGSGTLSRDYTYIEDIIDGIMAAIDLDCSFEIINLGGSVPVKLNRVVELLEKELGGMAYKRYLPIQKGDPESTWADTGKARRLLGFEPKVEIEEGIRRFVAWYRKDPGKLT